MSSCNALRENTVCPEACRAVGRVCRRHAGPSGAAGRDSQAGAERCTLQPFRTPRQETSRP